MFDKLTDKIVDRAPKMAPLSHTGLDSTTLHKVGHLALPGSSQGSHALSVARAGSKTMSVTKFQDPLHKEMETNLRRNTNRSPPSKWKVAFFDLDDCMYVNNWATAKKLTQKVDDYTTSILKLKPGQAYDLYNKYGTSLAGLVEEKFIDETDVQAFLDYVHDIDLGDIKPDPQLAKMLKQVNCRRWVFSASSPAHVERCLGILGVRNLFEGIIAASSVDMFSRAGYVSKHDPQCFQVAMDMAGVKDPKDCILLDDNVKNIQTAKKVGWHAVLVGETHRDGGKNNCPDADIVIGKIGDLLKAVPELCVAKQYSGTHSASLPRSEKCAPHLIRAGRKKFIPRQTRNGRRAGAQPKLVLNPRHTPNARRVQPKLFAFQSFDDYVDYGFSGLLAFAFFLLVLTCRKTLRIIQKRVQGLQQPLTYM